MFWIQLIFPLALSLFGVALLYADNQSRKHLFHTAYEKTKTKIVDFGQEKEDKSNIKLRLAEIESYSPKSYGEFRYRQFVVAALAGLIPFVGLFLMLLNLVQAILIALFTSTAGFLMYDRYLSTLVKNRRELIESEFPAVIEMLTLAIAAGETPLSAFARIADRSDSFLATEFANVVHEVRNGRPFHEALDEMSRNLKSPTIRRFIDALVMAIVRGAPIVEVLHRHVAEARINQRNLVMDKAGKAETTMMIPIVFLILPISVLFALWPSINQLSFFAS